MKFRLNLCVLGLVFGVSSTASAGFLSKEPVGFLISTEFEKNQGFTNATQDLLQNWTFMPRIQFGEFGEHMLKLSLGFGYSLTKPVKIFLYDAQVRYEKRNIFGPYEPFFFDFGAWLYGPVSQVSRDESVFISVSSFLRTYGSVIVPELSWYLQLEGRYWANQYSQPDPLSNYPQQRSSIHEIPKSQKHPLLNDRFAGTAKLGGVFSLAKAASEIPVLKNIWISSDVYFRVAHTYGVTTPSFPADNYHTLLVYHGLAWKVIDNLVVDFTIQHSGQLTSGTRKIHFFGSGTSYYLGINAEI